MLPRARVISFSQVGWHISIEEDVNPAVEVVSSDEDAANGDDADAMIQAIMVDENDDAAPDAGAAMVVVAAANLR